MRLPPSNWSFFPHSTNDSTERIVQNVILALFCGTILVTIIGNILTLLVVFRRKPLQKSVSNLYVASLGVSDLLIGLFIMTFMLIYTVVSPGDWPLEKISCHIWQLADMIFGTISLYNMCGIGFDRWWNLEKPLRVFKRNRKIARRMILGIWILPFLIYIPLFLALKTTTGYNQSSNNCYFEWRPKIIVLIIAIPFLYFPVIILVLLFIRIGVVVRSHLRFQRQHACRASRGSTASHNGPLLGSRKTTGELHALTVSSPYAIRKTEGRDITNGNWMELEQKRMAATPRNSPVPPDSLKMIRARIQMSPEPRSTPDRIIRGDINSQTAPKSPRTKLTVDIEQSAFSDSGPIILRRDALCRRKSASCQLNPPGSGSSSLRRVSQRLSVIPIPGSIVELLQNEGISRQLRATKAVGIIFLCFVICWLPFLILWPVKVYCDKCISNQVYLLAIWTNYLSSTLNPILYTLCSPTAKMTLSTYLPVRKTTKQRAARSMSLIL